MTLGHITRRMIMRGTEKCWKGKQRMTLVNCESIDGRCKMLEGEGRGAYLMRDEGGLR
jgi:hypothetical protein